jgi:hypothetical protein
MVELIVVGVCFVLSIVANVWYYAAIGKKVAEEEKKTGRDLTYEINPYTGSTKKVTDSSKKKN